jgi:enoyl-CoA hydratase
MQLSSAHRAEESTRMYQTISVEQHGRVMTVRLDNPPRNLLSNAVVADLTALTKRLAGDQSVGAVVITGAPTPFFATHADTHELLDQARIAADAPTPVPSYRQARMVLLLVAGMRRLPGGEALIRRTPFDGVATLLRWDELFLRMNASDKVFVAAINGMSLGGGLILALGCDLRYLADGEHALGLVESNIGFMAAAGGSQRLVRIMGVGPALELLLEGRALSPQEALELGLVHRVVPSEKLLSEAQTAAERMARRSPIATREIKRAVYDAGSRSLRQALRMEEASMMTTLPTPASIRSMEAYHERIGSFETVSDSEILDAWRALHEGEVVDLTTS